MDKARLRYEMAKKGVSIGEMCETLGISRSAFSRKCAGSSEFTLREIQVMIDYLDLDSPMGIFLPIKCLKRHFRPPQPQM